MRDVRGARLRERARRNRRRTESRVAVQSRIVLEPSAQEVVDLTSTHPFIYELEPATARKVLDDLQAAPIDKLPVDDEWITVPSPAGDARVRIVRPVGAASPLPVIVYMH